MYATLAQIKQANKAAGFHFFSDRTMRFFGSRASRTIYNGCLFVTSEQNIRDGQPRLYTIRRAMPDGSIETVGEFQQYATRKQAHAAAKALAHTEG